MRWKPALKIMNTFNKLRKDTYSDEEREAAFDAVYHAVQPLIELGDDGLEDWLKEGDYDGTETAISLATEWDSFVEDGWK